MLNCGCNQGSAVTLTETPTSYIWVIDGVPTIIPKVTDVQVTGFTYTATTRVLSITESNGDVNNVTVPLATTTNPGLVELATAADYPQPTNDLDAATPAYVKAAIDDLSDDPLTALVDVASLTDADRGLSLGEVDIPTTRALTIAEMTQANASNVGVSFRDMQAVYTNKAAEPTSIGMMNSNGQLGHYSRVYGSTQASLNAAVVESNGAHVRIVANAGETLVMPLPSYVGQIIEIRVTLPNPSDEIVVDFSAQSSGLGGVYRGSDHIINHGLVPDYFVIMRSGEVLRLVAGSTNWSVVNHNYRLFYGSNWKEMDDGTVNIIGSIASIPEGAIGSVTLPILLTGTGYGVFATQGASSVSAGGFPDAAEPVTGNKTVSGFDILAKQIGSLALTASFGYFITKATPDYAALGGVASF